MKLNELIKKSEELASMLQPYQIRLVPEDFSDKWINIDACPRKFQYGNAEIILEKATTPYFADKVLIINSRRTDSFLKKLGKYEDLNAEGWVLDTWSFDYATRKARALKQWIQDYLDATNSVMLSVHANKKPVINNQ